MSAPFLAAELDGEVVLLDVAQARLILLDPATRRVFETCEGRTTAEVTASLGGPQEHLAESLQSLAAAGLLREEDGRWRRAALRWVEPP
ncbi:MAG: hypothetical protein QN152_08065 [Armatimonadota bacterium]|nr:hypothetical protein [Armatimonadota bacterium]MDR7427578.1 hypothetical protein [Armatimonadota bacterium]MDR7465279.1 hypothetical protein [Armatimonadota bacterium]MDR7469765.1 hypothetical protein [Armatimonadota bacterium]MDR7474664.1 hypothetical protein [Armatimonadota bacterium]